MYYWRFGWNLQGILENNLNTDSYKVMFMSSLSIEVLKEIIDVVPDDFEVGFKKNDIYSPIGKVEIDVVDKRVVFKSVYV